MRLLLLATPWCAAMTAWAQPAERHRSPGEAILEHSPPVNNLIKRALEGIDRRDWKLAIDSLQRIIDDPQGVLLERSPGLYETARRYAERTLGNLEPRGLAAYRVLYDGRARAALDRAVAVHDVAALARVVNRYLLTSHGDNAADVLASWMLDAGRPAEALAIFERIELLCPDSDVPAESIAVRRAAALAMLGQFDSARAVAGDASSDLDPSMTDMLAGLIEALSDGNDAGSQPWRSPGDTRWPGILGGGRRGGQMPPVTPSLGRMFPGNTLCPTRRRVTGFGTSKRATPTVTHRWCKQ